MRKKILLIDDSPFFLAALCDSLAKEFDVEKADSGDKAIDLLTAMDCDRTGHAEAYDLVITDLEMPGLSGYDVARFIKGENRKNRFTPVIMLTGKDITKEEARQNGCAAYIPKTNLAKVVAMTRILLLR